jgi:hypothetical protein
VGEEIEWQARSVVGDDRQQIPLAFAQEGLLQQRVARSGSSFN